MSIIEKFSDISDFMGELFDFVQKDEIISKDFEEYLKTLSVNNPSQSTLQGHLLTYIFERKLDNRSILDIYETKHVASNNPLLNALKNVISGYFEIKKLHKNGFLLFNLLNEKTYDVVSLVKMSNFKGMYAGQFVNARIFNYDGTCYLLEVSDVLPNSAKNNIYRYLIAKIIQEPETAYYDNVEKEYIIKSHAQKTAELFVKVFNANEIVTKNEYADEILNILNDGFENNHLPETDISKFIQKPDKCRYFKVSEFTNDYNNFLENSLSGFSSHHESYDVGVIAHNEYGLYVLPFWYTINQIFEHNAIDSIEGATECVKYYIENDKIPLFVIEKLHMKYPDFIKIVDKVFDKEYTYDDVVKTYKSAYVGRNVYSPTSVLYTSGVFGEFMNFIEEEMNIRPVTEDDKFKGVGRNDPCPCGSGKKYKKCCLNK